MSIARDKILSEVPYKTYIHLLLILLISFAAYSNTFLVPFQFDDKAIIADNPSIGDLHVYVQPTSLKKYVLWRSVKDFFYTRYIGFLSFSLNYKLNGLDVFGYHVVNFLIHTINGLLVYFLVLLTQRTQFFNVPGAGYDKNWRTIAALVISLIFVSHPLQTQAVTYIAQRFTSLATMFYLLTLYLYIQFRLSSASRMRFVFYILAIASAISAMLTKEISFTLPIMLSIYELFFFKASVRQRLILLCPFLFLMPIIPLQFLHAKGLSETMGNIGATIQLANEKGISSADYLFTQFRVLVTYIRLMFFPVGQNVDYDYPIFRSFSDLPVLISFFFLASILGIALIFLFRSLHKSRYAIPGRVLAFGIFWFFITISIESSIIPIDDVIFEHRMYLPSIGLIVATIASLSMLQEKFSIEGLKARQMTIILFASIIILLTGTSYARNYVWHDEISLWEDITQKSPLKARAHCNLGEAYLNIGRYDKAQIQFQTAIKMSPNMWEAHNNLGMTYMNQNKLDDAIKEYLFVLKQNPYFRFTHNNLGLVYLNRGELAKAELYFTNALRLNPAFADAHFNLGATFEQNGRIVDATKEYQVAVNLNRVLINKLNNIGTCRFKAGRIDEAIQKYLIVAKLNPSLVQVHYNLALAYKKQNQLSHALDEMAIALKLKPDLSIAHYELALMYKQQNRIDEALTELEAAMRFQHEYTDAIVVYNAIKSNGSVR